MVNYGFFYPDNNVSFGETVYVCDVSSDQHQYALRKASGKHQYILANLLGQHVYSSPLPATSPPSNQLFPPSSSHLTGVFSLQSCYNMFDLASVDLEAFFDYSYSALDQEIFTAQSQFSALPRSARLMMQWPERRFWQSVTPGWPLSRAPPGPLPGLSLSLAPPPASPWPLTWACHTGKDRGKTTPIWSASRGLRRTDLLLYSDSFWFVFTELYIFHSHLGLFGCAF